MDVRGLSILLLINVDNGQEYQIMLGAGMATKMKKLNSCVVFEYFSTIIFKEDIEGLMVWGMN